METKAPGGIVAPDTPFGNVRMLRQVLRACVDHIWWAEPQFARKMLEPLYDEAASGMVKSICLLTGPPQADNDRSDVKRFASEMATRGIAVEWRTVETRDRRWHDRYIVTRDRAWNVPPTNTLYKGDYSEIVPTAMPPFETWWADAERVEGVGQVIVTVTPPPLAVISEPPAAAQEELWSVANGRQPIPVRVRREVWRRDQGRCVDCSSRERLEYDHIIPVSKGGSNTVRNIELRCESCNRQKAAAI
jgi:hypothetical protein